jgi:peptide/nickel transport system substrate-binding protein
MLRPFNEECAMDSDSHFDLVAWLGAADLTTRRQFLRRAALIGLGLPAAAALAAACGGGSSNAAKKANTTAPSAASASAGTAAAATSGKKPKQGGTFITMGHQNVDSLSPQDAGPTVLYVCTYNIHEPLLKFDVNFKLVPQLAESYQVSTDGKSYTFKLRNGVKWQDGQPFTSADVKYYYEWIANPANAAILQPNFAQLDHVDTPDDLTAVAVLKQADAPFAALAATVAIVPKHVHEKLGEKGYSQHPVGTGPWKLKDWNPAQFVLLEANDTYWGGRPWIDLWRENIVPEVAVRAVALQTGQADSSTWPIAPQDQLNFLKDSKIQTYQAPGGAVNHFPLNNLRPFFQDKRVRQAMLTAIDRDSLVKNLLKGLAVTAISNYSPAYTQYFEPNVTLHPFDPAKAKALLKDAGWTPGSDGILIDSKGNKFHFTATVFTGDTLRRSEAETVQQQLKEVGIDMAINEGEPTSLLPAFRKGDFDMALFNWTYGGIDPDASDTLSSKGANNWSHWSNAQVDTLLDQGRVEVDPAKRKLIYSQIQKIVSDEVPFLYIMFWNTVLEFNKRIKGMPTEQVPNPYQFYQEFQHYWINEE